MTFELVAVIAIGTAFLLGVLMLIEHERWAGASVRPIRDVAGSRLLGRLADRIRDSVLAWLIGGAVTRIRRIAGRQDDATGPAVRATTRLADGSSAVVRPVPVRPTRIVVAGERRPMPVGSTAFSAQPTQDGSPRRRLWRDASAVLAVIAVAAVAVALGSQQSTGGVLSATATPPATSGLSGGHGAPGSPMPGATADTVASPDAVPTPDVAATTVASQAPGALQAASGGPPSASGGPPAPTAGPPSPTPRPQGPAPTRPAPAPTPSPGVRPTRVPVAVTPTARPAPPVARFTATPASGAAPLTVSFSDASTGAISAWAWDFGDGSTSSARNPAHTFDAPGIYGVTLTVTAAAGSDSYALTIRVEGSTPTP